ncbi:hypothetical protein [Methylomonas sp. AM2-LC]|uniref:hypothetical protein n=1 Tax=Methylomonas sp. AM2-LC TaxID=3153301 RepID=UPI00326661EC
MKINYKLLRIQILISCLLILSACEKLGINTNKTNALGNRPDLDCIIANDFYAVHFSSYIQPVKGEPVGDTKAAFVPYCQKIPHAGRMFFTADLIDRDIRTTPIGIRLVEVEKTTEKAPNDYRVIRTVVDLPAKLYPRGAVEAQADIDKNGDYQLILLIGDAIEDDDKFKISLEVGVDPNALPVYWIIVSGASLLIIIVIFTLIYRKKNKHKAINIENKQNSDKIE